MSRNSILTTTWLGCVMLREVRQRFTERLRVSRARKIGGGGQKPCADYITFTTELPAGFETLEPDDAIQLLRPQIDDFVESFCKIRPRYCAKLPVQLPGAEVKRLNEPTRPKRETDTCGLSIRVAKQYHAIEDKQLLQVACLVGS